MFQRTKEHDIWIAITKVMKDQSFFGRGSKVVSSTYMHIGFEDVQYSGVPIKMAFLNS